MSYGEFLKASKAEHSPETFRMWLIYSAALLMRTEPKGDRNA